jgi:hypothetical protein
MANPAAEIRNRIQQQWPGATVSKRWRNGIELTHPDNPQRHALEATIGPIHYGAGENLEIDTAWLPSGDAAWQWAMTENDYHAHSRDVFNSGNLIRYTHAASGLWVQFDPQSLNWRNQDNSQHQIAVKQAVAAVVEDDVLRWPAAWGAGRHFQFQCQTGRLQKLLTVDSAANLPTPTVTGDIVLELEYSLSIAAGLSFWIDGVEWTRTNGVRVTTANHIECRNSAGDVLFWLAPPRAWDSNGSETGGLLQVHRNGGPNALFINVRIPRAWIETAQFPIYIDPTIDATVAASLDDGRVYQGTGNYGSIDNQCYAGYTIDSSNGVSDSWARFTGISGLNGATVDVAYYSAHGTAKQGTPLTAIYAEDAASASAPTSVSDYNARTRTTAKISWNDPSWSNGVYNNSPSIVSVIQELVEEYGGSLSVIQIFHQDDGSGTGANNRLVYKSYDHVDGVPPKLHIEYTEGGGETLSITIDPTTTTKSGVRIWG